MRKALTAGNAKGIVSGPCRATARQSVNCENCLVKAKRYSERALAVTKAPFIVGRRRARRVTHSCTASLRRLSWRPSGGVEGLMLPDLMLTCRKAGRGSNSGEGRCDLAPRAKGHENVHSRDIRYGGNVAARPRSLNAEGNARTAPNDFDLSDRRGVNVLCGSFGDAHNSFPNDASPNGRIQLNQAGINGCNLSAGCIRHEYFWPRGSGCIQNDLHKVQYEGCDFAALTAPGAAQSFPSAASLAYRERAACRPLCARRGAA